MKKKYALALLLTVSMAFAACGQKTDNYPEESSFLTEQPGGVQVTSLGALDGVWFNSDGDLLEFDSTTESYRYQTYYGRVGSGEYSLVQEDLPMLEFDGFLYDFTLEEGDMLVLHQNGSGDAESLDGMCFWWDEEDDLMSWDIIDMDGVWQDAEGETLVIDRNRMEYLACTSEMFRTGTIYDNYDGKGLYLYLNGYAYVCPGTDGFSFTLAFEPSEYEEANGTFTGVFSDNIEEFVYDPAQDWGDDWMTSLWD